VTCTENVLTGDDNPNVFGGASAVATNVFVRTDDGTIAYLTLGLDAASPLAEAHARASEIEERIRRARPDIADVIVHTEP